MLSLCPPAAELSPKLARRLLKSSVVKFEKSKFMSVVPIAGLLLLSKPKRDAVGSEVWLDTAAIPELALFSAGNDEFAVSEDVLEAAGKGSL